VQTEINELGRRLTEERVERGWSVQDVARELRLSPFQVNALENGSYDELPGDTYVRGYLRAYARLLRIPVDQVLSLHSQASPGAPNPDNALAPRVRREARSSDRLMKVVTGLLVIVVVLMLVLWWQGRGSGLTLESTDNQSATRTSPAAGEPARLPAVGGAQRQAMETPPPSQPAPASGAAKP